MLLIICLPFLAICRKLRARCRILNYASFYTNCHILEKIDWSDAGLCTSWISLI
ncbi:hypothetical protein KC19_2G130600 [Ceratodon purpureus]|uniref:Uncharacterized protein n=1 Tax=Ceratodon purpureus TaxID=3225 RepID=A0A8T0IX73_CERPU|nr:hypothetical protein KC19_2G130600 [Ceratodon purpureus]